MREIYGYKKLAATTFGVAIGKVTGNQLAWVMKGHFWVDYVPASERTDLVKVKKVVQPPKPTPQKIRYQVTSAGRKPLTSDCTD